MNLRNVDVRGSCVPGRIVWGTSTFLAERGALTRTHVHIVALQRDGDKGHRRPAGDERNRRAGAATNLRIRQPPVAWRGRLHQAQTIPSGFHCSRASRPRARSWAMSRATTMWLATGHRSPDVWEWSTRWRHASRTGASATVQAREPGSVASPRSEWLARRADSVGT